ncbi:hypothetical protein IHV09_14205 [Fictibacillus sp. 23RED33]|uniref:hypothetical protein n=1 Tax=Fictibacillus sp. 23RED33 TaxID=2745879 RepID=UPI0018CED063|nr:hypothetical protein [Fictibacillus sp. 23RED33]MBH0174717.1 hypothetical protein [Fictibacillus sp. 23RED33]
MEIKVLKRFKDKNTKKVFPVGALYQSDDEERILFLQEKGYLEKSIPLSPEEIEVEQLLTQNVDAIRKSILSDMGKEKLNNLLAIEKEDKNRKGVIDHIEGLLKEGE